MKKLQLLIKPVSSACNLKCAYCFYRDEEQHRMDRGRGRMDTETVKVIVDKALAAAQTCVRLPGRGADVGRSAFF